MQCFLPMPCPALACLCFFLTALESYLVKPRPTWIDLINGERARWLSSEIKVLCLRPLKTHKGTGTGTGNRRGQAGIPPPLFSLVCIVSVQPPFPSRRRRERPCLLRLHPLAPLYTLHPRNDTHRWKGDGERGKGCTFCQEDDKAADGGERDTCWASCSPSTPHILARTCQHRASSTLRSSRPCFPARSRATKGEAETRISPTRASKFPSGRASP